MIAAIDLHPAVSIALAVIAGVLIGWYWFRLGRAGVPASRRRIRRFSMAIMLISLPVFVRAASFLDADTQPREYVIAWMAGMLLAAIVIATAVLDAMNNLRLHQRHAHEEAARSARELVEAIRKRENPLPLGEGRSPQATRRGEVRVCPDANNDPIAPSPLTPLPGGEGKS